MAQLGQVQCPDAPDPTPAVHLARGLSQSSALPRVLSFSHLKDHRPLIDPQAGCPVKHPQWPLHSFTGRDPRDMFTVLKLKFTGKNKQIFQQKSRIRILPPAACACWSPRPGPLPPPGWGHGSRGPGCSPPPRRPSRTEAVLGLWLL